MPQAKPEKETVKVNFEFRRKLAQKIEGNLANFCYQCGACVGDCPAATYSKGVFNPREIILKILYGVADDLVVTDSIVWMCTSCYNCHERCPQEVKPVEVIIALKNLLADEGLTPGPVEKVIRVFEKTGRTVSLNPAIDKRRAEFGLPPLAPVPMEEIQCLLEPADNGGES